MPKNLDVFILIYTIHHDKKYFASPERFDPDRFLSDNSKDRHPHAFIPFSAGRRNFIGQRFAMIEEKVLLCHVLRKFELIALKQLEELRPTADLVLRAINGIPIKLIPRKLEKNQ